MMTGTLLAFDVIAGAYVAGSLIAMRLAGDNRFPLSQIEDGVIAILLFANFAALMRHGGF